MRLWDIGTIEFVMQFSKRQMKCWNTDWIILWAVLKIKFFSPLRHKGTKKTNNNKHFAASRLCGKVFFEF
ncbi:MAG: hypothetical protein AUJ54_09850 [Ignavibacteria bacterium CG1_02_37_35]|nr:MAG: hypothetical protein AUJ54_09850 [Ignavibacteria bacterium CG1_02_37_35]